MIGICDVEVQASNPAMPLYPLRAFVDSPSSLRIRNVPKKLGTWQITKVYFTAAYPDNELQTTNCTLIGGVWVGTIAGSTRAGYSQNGYTVFADGIDENGDAVNGYVLGKGDIRILDADSTISPDEPLCYMHLLSAESDQPKDGDVWQYNGSWYIYQDGQAWPIGDESGLISELSGELESLTNEVDMQGSTIQDNSYAILEINQALNKKADATALSDYALSADVHDELETKADASSLTAYVPTTQLSDITAIKLAHDETDEHSTRVIVDEYDNVILQKYILSGWYVDKIEVGPNLSACEETDAYWGCVSADIIVNNGKRLYYVIQDKARTLPVLTSWKGTSDMEATEISGYGIFSGTDIYFKIYFSYATTPTWVDAARLVPDGSTYSGLLASQITNNKTFLTPNDIELGRWIGYADKAVYSAIMLGYTNGALSQPTKLVQFCFNNDVPTVQTTNYAPWYLSEYFGTTFASPREMTFGYRTTVTIRINNRPRTISINDYVWLAGDATNGYHFIRAAESDDGNFYPVKICNTSGASIIEHEITEFNSTSIVTVDGEANQVVCTRDSNTVTYTYRYLTYKDELSSSLSDYYTQTQVDTKLNDYLPLSGGIMSAYGGAMEIGPLGAAFYNDYVLTSFDGTHNFEVRMPMQTEFHTFVDRNTNTSLADQLSAKQDISSLTTAISSTVLSTIWDVTLPSSAVAEGYEVSDIFYDELNRWILVAAKSGDQILWVAYTAPSSTSLTFDNGPGADIYGTATATKTKNALGLAYESEIQQLKQMIDYLSAQISSYHNI